MGTADEARIAIEKTNGADLGGRNLQVNEARPKEDRPGGGFGGGGGGGGRRGFEKFPACEIGGTGFHAIE
jgi:RNA recognition motif-containing protein